MTGMLLDTPTVIGCIFLSFLMITETCYDGLQYSEIIYNMKNICSAIFALIIITFSPAMYNSDMRKWNTPFTQHKNTKKNGQFGGPPRNTWPRAVRFHHNEVHRNTFE